MLRRELEVAREDLEVVDPLESGDDLGAIGAAGLLDRLGRDAHGVVGLRRVGAGVGVELRLVVGDPLLATRDGRRRLGHRREDTLRVGLTGNVDELLVDRAVRHHDLAGVAGRAELLDEQATLLVVAGPVDEVGVGPGDRGDSTGVVRLTSGDRLLVGDGHARGLEVLGGAGGDVLGVGRVVIDEGDRLGALGLDEVRRGLGLLDARAVDEEDVLEAALEQVRRVGRGDEHRDVGLLEDGQRRESGAGAVATDRDVDPGRDELGGTGRGGLRVARLVLDGEGQLAPVDAAGGVDLVDGHLGAVLHVRPDGGRGPAERGQHAELDVALVSTTGARRRIRETAATTGREAECDSGGREDRGPPPDRVGHDALLPGHCSGRRTPSGRSPRRSSPLHPHSAV